MSLKQSFTKLSEKIKNQFKENLQILSFEEYLQLLEDRYFMQQQTRGAAHYIHDLLDNFGFEKTFPHVIGLQAVKQQLKKILKSQSQIGISNRLILLHGPNGSAKSTLVSDLMRSLEHYSKTPAGALYTFSWVFPTERISKGALGFGQESPKKSQEGASYAHLKEDDISCIIPSELHDHPLLFIPLEERRILLKECSTPLRLKEGELSHRDQLIFNALLNNYQGDYSQVLRHVRVERFYLSRAYRSGLISVEPQMHVDAQYQQLTLNRSLQSLPVALQGINLFSLSGDLPDANRGLIDYSDLLKRPIDTFKYLLTACESGQVSVGHSILHLDTLYLGSSNELQLDAFKEYPDFSSFKGRLELIRVPYLLSVSDEQKIYEDLIPQVAGEKPITPHVAWVLSLWAVLTRLKKPQREHYPSALGLLMDRFTPLDKLKLYDHEEIPERFNAEERKVIKANLNLIYEEFEHSAFYEGRTGASARELKNILIEASQNSNHKTLSPLAVVHELKEFVQRTSEYEFLRQEVNDGFHHHEQFIETALQEYTEKIDREVRECLRLVDAKQWSEFMKRYMNHLSALLKNERIKNAITGDYEQPDQALLDEFESIIEAPSSQDAKTQFRQNLISLVGAWVLDHPKTPVDYFKVFPEIRQKLEKHYYETQKGYLQKMHTALKSFGTEHEDPNSEGSRLAQETLENMQKKFRYPIDGAKEVIHFLMGRKY